MNPAPRPPLRASLRRRCVCTCTRTRRQSSYDPVIDRPDRAAGRPELATFADVSIAPVIDIVPPCLDEAAAMPWVMRRMPLSARAIVVDNGSTNGSAEITRRPRVLVVECVQRGYGTACHTGSVAATADVVALCDGSLDRTDGLRLADNVAAGGDLVISRRRPNSRAARPLPALAGQPFAATWTRLSEEAA